MTDDKAYNGWKNYETWNVALWIGNDEGLYSFARDCCRDYGDFQAAMRDEFKLFQTDDGVAWNDSGLDTDALDDMIRELRGEEVEAE